MLALYRRECARIVQEAHAEEQQGIWGEGTYGKTTATQEQLDEMVANMMAEPVGEKTLSDSAACLPNFANVVPASRREHWITQLEITISKGLVDLKGYDEHIKGIREGYKKALEREMQSDMDLD